MQSADHRCIAMPVRLRSRNLTAIGRSHRRKQSEYCRSYFLLRFVYYVILNEPAVGNCCQVQWNRVWDVREAYTQIPEVHSQ